MTRAIDVVGLTKTYDSKEGRTVHAVKGIDLHVDEGEILAFLGSNGAGKTTTIEILEGFRPRTSGQVSVLGEDPSTAPLSWRENIGVVLQESEPDADLTAREVLTQYSAYYRDPRPVGEVLEIVGLTEHGDQRNKVLSGGQKRRLDLAIALIGNPRLVFLDEPTTGFDPSARRDAWGMVENLRSVGVTVLLTTHYMDEAEYLADRITVISAGEIVAEGSAEDLASQVDLRTRVSWQTDELSADALPSGFQGKVDVHEGVATIETDDVTSVVHALVSHAVDANRRLDSLSVTRPNLEDTFLRLTETGDAAGGTAPAGNAEGGA